MLMYPNPAKTLQEIHEDINVYMQSFASGQDINIQTLDNKIRFFCGMLKQLPPTEAKTYKDSINEITEHLSSLITKLEAGRDLLEDKINSLNRHNIAHNAYGNALILALQTAKGEE